MQPGIKFGSLEKHSTDCFRQVEFNAIDLEVETTLGSIPKRSALGLNVLILIKW